MSIILIDSKNINILKMKKGENMFLKLMNKEIKNQLKSITFYMFLLVLVIYYITQYVPSSPYDPLKPLYSNLKDDGTRGILDNKINEMTFIYYRMNYNLENEAYVKYILGTKRWKKLNMEQKNFLQKMKNKVYNDKLNNESIPEILVSYNEFQKIKNQIDKALGGNTIYSPKYRDNIFLDMYYGHKPIEDENLKIRAGYREMSMMLNMNKYLKSNPILTLYKELSHNQKNSLENAMKRISPYGIDEKGNLIDPVNYKKYELILDKLDKEFGDTTIFSKKYRNRIYLQNKTYIDALKDFKEILNKDKVTSAYGRYLSDYMGITAGFYPIFVVAAMFLRDRKKNISNLFGNKKISPIIYILSKYSGVCISLLICYLILATHSTYVFYRISKNYNYLIDIWAFYKYTLTWIAPTILFTVAISMLLFGIFNKISIPIISQFLLWFSSIQTLGGDYSLYRFIIRFNYLGNYKDYITWRPDIITNRAFYTILSLIIILLAAYVYKKPIENNCNCNTL